MEAICPLSVNYREVNSNCVFFHAIRNVQTEMKLAVLGTQRVFDMALSILKMGPVLFGSTEDLISFLQGKGLLATNKQCPNCSSTMDLQRRSDIEDKFRLY